MAELLSPAGSMHSFRAALAAGADAVYAGCTQFSARANAENFTTEEMTEAVDECHLLGRRLYLTLNTLLKDSETEEISGILSPLYRAGLDGIIVQDLGVADYVREHFPNLPLHASTQLAVTGKYGAACLSRLGFMRVVPARELSLGELREIHDFTDIEIEAFIHGAMCYSYSGICLMSSFFGGRSGNRGRCAGCCRQSFEVPSGKKGKAEGYFLSMKDLCAVTVLPELIGAGVCSLKIEGRMKGPEYVYAVTKIYRKYLDILENEGAENYRVDEADLKNLSEIYLRGSINEGYFKRHNAADMVTFERGSYRSEKDAVTDIPSPPACMIKGRFTTKEGERVRLHVETRDGEKHYEKAGVVAGRAEGHPMGREEIVKHLNKTGGTCFSFSSLDIELGEGVFIPVSALNSLRRDVLAGLREEILCDYRRVV
ncbi:MAG: U32 family peptidase [Lachnospiraceae bacterium]|nr:U32 family peptidase [Lachnospiraceae bacterium]